MHPLVAAARSTVKAARNSPIVGRVEAGGKAKDLSLVHPPDRAAQGGMATGAVSGTCRQGLLKAGCAGEGRCLGTSPEEQQ